MKISDEIRKWCDNADVDGAACVELYALADRIDREMVELPKDKDGEPINLGDEVYLDGKNGHVTRIDYRIDNECYVIFWSGSECIVCTETELAELTHNRPDSLVRIADDLDEWCGSVDVDGDVCGKPRELADRIRKLAEKEGK